MVSQMSSRSPTQSARSEHAAVWLLQSLHAVVININSRSVVCVGDIDDLGPHEVFYVEYRLILRYFSMVAAEPVTTCRRARCDHLWTLKATLGDEAVLYMILLVLSKLSYNCVFNDKLLHPQLHTLSSHDLSPL
jgi:hypothetical protein